MCVPGGKGEGGGGGGRGVNSIVKTQGRFPQTYRNARNGRVASKSAAARSIPTCAASCSLSRQAILRVSATSLRGNILAKLGTARTTVPP